LFQFFLSFHNIFVFIIMSSWRQFSIYPNINNNKRGSVWCAHRHVGGTHILLCNASQHPKILFYCFNRSTTVYFLDRAVHVIDGDPDCCWWVFFPLFSLSLQKNYNLTLFVNSTLISVFILLIFNFYSWSF